MATITKRLGKDGAVSYRAQVRIKKDGRIVYSEARTFPREKLAKDWAARLELELKQPGAIEDRRKPKLSLGELIPKYVKEVEQSKPLGRTKLYVLKMLLDYPIAEIPAAEISPSDLLEHCRARAKEGAGPATVAHDVSYLKSILFYAKSIWQLPLQQAIHTLESTLPELHKQGLVGKSRPRDRRPTESEVTHILEGLRKRRYHVNGEIPHDEMFEFAIYSCMRVSEVTSLLWEDLDEEKRCVLVRNRKDPKHKQDNHQLVPLLGPAWDIVSKQPRTDDRIFPYESKSVSRGYQDVRSALGIVDLRFHDMRHEGISRLFEMGYSIEQVAMVSGHRSWTNLKRYTHLRPESLHERYAQAEIKASRMPTASREALLPVTAQRPDRDRR